MQKFYTISQTAQMVNTTAETLRHYDRIGLIKPSKIDEWTNYRYYSEQDMVSLHTIRALKCMGLSLNQINDILQQDDFAAIVDHLKLAEQQADIKIAELNHAKAKIHTARLHYESKIDSINNDGIIVKHIPQRIIMLSKDMSEPTLDNLWDYHRHFYKQLESAVRDEFAFEDVAGVYHCQGQSQMFAVCARYSCRYSLTVLPEGNYLCADCSEATRQKTLDNLLAVANNKYSVEPQFIISIVILSGILKWNYQLQILIDDKKIALS